MMLDFLGITIVIIFFIRGYMKGIVVAVFSLLAVMLGIIAALKLSGRLGQWFLEKGLITSAWGQLISYVILFLAVMLIVRLIAKMIEKTLQLAMLGWLNGLVGGLLYAFMAAVIWSSFLWLGHQVGLISPEMRHASVTYRYLEPLAPAVFDQVGKLLPFAKGVFTGLQQFFSKLS